MFFFGEALEYLGSKLLASLLRIGGAGSARISSVSKVGALRFRHLEAPHAQSLAKGHLRKTMGFVIGGLHTHTLAVTIICMLGVYIC